MYPNHTRESPPRLTLEVKIHTNLPGGHKHGGPWQAIQEKRKIIRSTGIKTAYNPFHSHLLHRPSPAQPLLGRYLPRLSSHYSRNFLAETFAKR